MWRFILDIYGGRLVRRLEGVRELRFFISTKSGSFRQRVAHRALAPVLTATRARTIRYMHAVLHSTLEQAVAWRLLARNPAAGVALPGHSRAEMRVLTPEEARRFLEHAIRWSDVDWASETRDRVADA